MEFSQIIVGQVIIVFLLILIGFILGKMKIITETGSKQITNLLLGLVTPAVVIKAYQRDFEPRLIKNLLFAFLLAILIHAIGIVLVKFLFKKEETNHYRINRFASIYSNCGFMAIPLLNASLGSDGVFFGSAYLIIFTVLYWTHGVYVFTEDKTQISFKKAVINPGVIGAVISLLFFFLQIRLTGVFKETLDYVAGLNTPLAMIILGTFLTRIDLKKTFTNFEIYKTAFIRLILMPILFVLIAKILKTDPNVTKAVLISASCPVATNTTLFASKYNCDATYAAEVVSFSTILSIVTIPLILLFV